MLQGVSNILLILVARGLWGYICDASTALVHFLELNFALME